MRKIYSLLMFIMIVVVFSGCKKDNTEMGRDQVRMALISVESEEHTSAKVEASAPVTTYTNIFKASIISPGKVDLNDHGFMIPNFNSPTGFTFISLGSTDKRGYVETQYDTTVNLKMYPIVFYGVTKSGDTLKSSDPVSSKNFDIKLGIAPPTYTAIGTTLYFIADIWNYNPSVLTIIEQGVNYDTQVYFASNKKYRYNKKYTGLNIHQPMYDSYNGAATPLALDGDKTNPLLVVGDLYSFEVYFIVKNSLTGETRTFTTPVNNFMYSGK